MLLKIPFWKQHSLWCALCKAVPASGLWAEPLPPRRAHPDNGGGEGTPPRTFLVPQPAAPTFCRAGRGAQVMKAVAIQKPRRPGWKGREGRHSMYKNDHRRPALYRLSIVPWMQYLTWVNRWSSGDIKCFPFLRLLLPCPQKSSRFLSSVLFGLIVGCFSPPPHPRFIKEIRHSRMWKSLAQCVWGRGGAHCFCKREAGHLFRSAWFRS